MGVGKTTVCRLLKQSTENSAFLDGDWCWDINPFRVTEETKAMVLDNICHLLQNFINCSEIQTVYFCWVMHEQAIIDELVSRLSLTDCRVYPISLVCSPGALTARLQADVDAGLRSPDVLARSLNRLPLYEQLDTCKVDVTNRTPQQTAAYILNVGEA